MSVKVGLRYIDLWKSDLENQVCTYEREPLRTGEIVFYGPSYFTRWSKKWGVTPLREAILGKSGAPCCINRGFGSSCSEHQLYYYPRMVRPLQPRVLVYSCFANASAFGYTPEETWELAQRVITYALTDFPGIHVYISGAGPARDISEEKMAVRLRFNGWVREFAEQTPGCYVADVLADCPALLDPSMFVEDGVHFNPEGYKVYADYFRGVLRDELEKY